jgi:thiopeptide-type bacteriocin biosynthesis protein
MELVSPIGGLFCGQENWAYEGSAATPLPTDLWLRISEAIHSRETLDLTEAEVDRFLKDRPLSPLAISFAVGFLRESDCTWIRKIYSGPGIRPVGRFLEFLDKGHGASDFLPKLPGNFLWAAIGSLPPDKFKWDLFNLKRNELKYIDLNCAPKPTEDAIDLRDLDVVLRNDMLLLWNRRLRKYILPAELNAVNIGINPNPVANLLYKIAAQFCVDDVEFSWDGMTGFEWLPRLQFKNVVLAPQQWHFSSKTIKKEIGGSDSDFDRWRRKTFKDVRVVSVHYGHKDNFLDLGSFAARGCLLSLANKFSELQIRELPSGSVTGMEFDGKSLRTEFIQTFMKPASDLSTVQPLSGTKKSSLRNPVLYFNIQAPPWGQNLLLTKISKLLKRTGNDWFFIRYEETIHSVRIRVFCKTKKEYYRRLEQIEKFLQSSAVSGAYVDYRIETYQMENTVYTDRLQQDLYHDLSAADSGQAIRILSLVKESEDSTLSWMMAAWASILAYNDLFKPEIERLSRAKLPRDETVKNAFYEAKKAVLSGEKKKNAILFSYERFRKGELSGDLRKRVAKLGIEERNHLFMRMCHLSLNRLNPDLLTAYEPSLIAHALAVHELFDA